MVSVNPKHSSVWFLAVQFVRTLYLWNCRRLISGTVQDWKFPLLLSYLPNDIRMQNNNLKNAVSSCINWQRDGALRIPNDFLLSMLYWRKLLDFNVLVQVPRNIVVTNCRKKYNVIEALAHWYKTTFSGHILRSPLTDDLNASNWNPQLISITQFSSTNIVVWRHPQFPAYARHTQNTPSIPRAGINIKQWLIVENKTAPTTTLTLTVKVKPHRAL